MNLKFKIIPVLILAAAARLAAQTDLTAFDQTINALIAKYHIPGATVAVARGGKLVLARAYGLADQEHNIPTQSDSLFRIASISKSFTATTILKLIDEGRLDLNTKVFPLLDQLRPPPGRHADARLQNITILKRALAVKNVSAFHGGCVIEDPDQLSGP